MGILKKLIDNVNPANSISDMDRIRAAVKRDMPKASSSDRAREVSRRVRRLVEE